VNRNRRNNPVGERLLMGTEMFKKVAHTIGPDESSSGTFGLPKIFRIGVYHHKAQILDLTG
jgi:hypothetical protein